MTPPTLTQTRLAHGLWEGQLIAEAPLPVEAWHLDRRLDGVTVTALPSGGYQVQVPLPGDILSEGVQTVLLRVGDMVLAQITLVAGVPLEDDLRAEISLLRAELDLLKRAFRRHCAETAG
jgi:hypothetical protein